MLKFDNDGYDINGFNIQGIHKITKTRFDEEGYDYKGYNEQGFNKYGFRRDGSPQKKIQKMRYVSVYAVNRESDRWANASGYNLRGFNIKNQINKYTGQKFDRRGFLFNGINIETGTMYNKYGHDAYGYNEAGFNEYGFNRYGIFEHTGTRYDFDGYDKDGYDEQNFNRKGFNRDTGTKVDINGFSSKKIMQKKAELKALRKKNQELDRYLEMAEKVARSKEIQEDIDAWKSPKETSDDDEVLL